MNPYGGRLDVSHFYSETTRWFCGAFVRRVLNDEGRPICSLFPDHIFERIFGCSLPDHGVVHIAAVTRHNERFRVLRIQHNTPKSDVDFYVLNAVRAWADVVLTSASWTTVGRLGAFDVSRPSEVCSKDHRRPFQDKEGADDVRFSGVLALNPLCHPVVVERAKGQC